MEVLERSDQKLVLSDPLTIDYATAEMLGETEDLFWQDIYIEPDVVEGDPNVIYLVDSAFMRLYWGYLDDREFEREPDFEAEQEILQSMGFIDSAQNSEAQN